MPSRSNTARWGSVQYDTSRMRSFGRTMAVVSPAGLSRGASDCGCSEVQLASRREVSAGHAAKTVPRSWTKDTCRCNQCSHDVVGFIAVEVTVSHYILLRNGTMPRTVSECGGSYTCFVPPTTLKYFSLSLLGCIECHAVLFPYFITEFGRGPEPYAVPWVQDIYFSHISLVFIIKLAYLDVKPIPIPLEPTKYKPFSYFG